MTNPLFQPLRIRSLELSNRIVMSPMTRTYSIEGVPGRDVADYYRRRAEGGTGLIVTEGVAIDHETAVDHANVPNLHTPAAQAGWRKVVDDVHAAGGKIVPQLWHVGPLWGAMTQMDPSLKPMRPSGEWGPLGVTSYSAAYVERAQASTEAMTEQDIQDVIDAYVRSAKHAVELGFDGIAIHGGHGYLLDSFFWEGTNQRDDAWGGDLERRTRFPAAVVAAIRAAIGPDLPIIYRFSQHKQQDFTAKIAETPEELGVILGALVDAGVDVLDASIRRFDVPAFEGSDLSLAGWAKKLTGAVTMAVGSVGIGKSLRDSRIEGVAPVVDNIPQLEERIGSGEFDLIAIGRLHLADPALATTLRAGGPLPAFDRAVHEGSLI
ncbi:MULTISPECIES: oxidoreductase [Rhodococcus]|uniref:12-oxophytodienoate reductase n=2 Tax=Rhodococcus erythropolis group TaxID=2840174 RepID=A0A6G9D0D6_RHOER|nr:MULTISPECIES: 12-oxophytodienoate reductase [Rhodococcus]EEN90511.1 oxidoreductase, FAD/FMN-binding protein [Rhodococcus erythropolis SK121]ANQ70450.1 12-oxophytodienoate reductase [Rhodococcus sp. 008]ARE36151.1 12-oxophytodienoate reductase [Rhodococcus sp. BH4]AZI64161.1 12-oxophytodienoate reductase [Rhodococcus sp. NJ-530]EME22795.1 oxidoreductase [Rhodococcus qingshengii BKS 20-40]